MSLIVALVCSRKGMTRLTKIILFLVAIAKVPATMGQQPLFGPSKPQKTFAEKAIAARQKVTPKNITTYLNNVAFYVAQASRWEHLMTAQQKKDDFILGGSQRASLDGSMAPLEKSRIQLNNQEIDIAIKELQRLIREQDKIHASVARQLTGVPDGELRPYYEGMKNGFDRELRALEKVRPTWQTTEIIQLLSKTHLGRRAITFLQPGVVFRPLEGRPGEFSDKGKPSVRYVPNRPNGGVIWLPRWQTSKQAAPSAAHEMYHVFEDYVLGLAPDNTDLNRHLQAYFIQFRVWEQLGKPNNALHPMHLLLYESMQNARRRDELEIWYPSGRFTLFPDN